MYDSTTKTTGWILTVNLTKPGQKARGSFVAKKLIPKPPVIKIVPNSNVRASFLAPLSITTSN